MLINDPKHNRLQTRTDATICDHGGDFFHVIGSHFDQLHKSRLIINADVLDAWFPPSAKALTAIRKYLPWLLQTSPPVEAEGLVDVLAQTRGLPADNILTGSGSSSLIFLAFRQWFDRNTRVLIPDPTYGEYDHICKTVLGCRVDRFALHRHQDYQLDLNALGAQLRQGYDLLVLVNPNSPTAQHVPRPSLEAFIKSVPPATLIWLDETYVEYAGRNQSLEQLACAHPNLVICKSMSKVYSLSGLRVGYLVASPARIAGLRAINPPWSVSLIAQLAAVYCLQDGSYYEKKYRETHRLRLNLAAALSAIPGLQVLPSITNFLLCHLAPEMPNAADFVQHCQRHGLYIRNASSMGRQLGDRAIRLAVKDRATNDRMIEIINKILEDPDDKE